LKKEKLQGRKKTWSGNGWNRMANNIKTQKFKGEERKDQDILIREKSEGKKY
jgi:hypothetical protein